MKKKSTNIQSETDWQRAMGMTDEEIDTSDIPELTDDFLKMPMFDCLDGNTPALIYHPLL